MKADRSSLAANAVRLDPALKIILLHGPDEANSRDIARQIGVSVRTMHDAVQRYRGISLHRYLRLRRLWLVRQRLLAGPQSIKACALAFGFWHLGDFSRIYRSQYGESPSETIARARET